MQFLQIIPRPAVPHPSPEVLLFLMFEYFLQDQHLRLLDLRVLGVVGRTQLLQLLVFILEKL